MRTLLIDSLNLFLRFYIVDPSISINGFPIGGLQGSLKGLQKSIREIKPDKIIIVWDGAGGSVKRKGLKKDYKGGRSPIRLNWNVKMMTDAEKEDNKVWQMLRLTEYYDEMPICQMIFDGVEADDVIAYACSLLGEREQKIILSNDKDFIQLLNKSTILYRPTQNEFLNVGRVIEKYGVHPNNFALARSTDSDRSDNIVGIKGVGIKSLSKRFPFLTEEKDYYVYDLVEHSKKMIEEEKSKIKLYQKICNNIELIKENYEIMQLSSPAISFQTRQKIKNMLSNYKENLVWNKTKFRTMLIRDGFGKWNWDTLEQSFNRIIFNSKIKK